MLAAHGRAHPIARPHGTTRRKAPLAAIAAVALLAASTSAKAEPAVLALEDAVRLALERNERARVSGEVAAAAEARVRRARAFFFPEVTLSGAYTRRLHETVRLVGGSPVTIQKANALSAQANLALTLFDARAFPLYRQARLERDAARLNADEDRRLLAFEAADAYLMTLSLHQVVQAADRRLQFAAASLKDARARFEAQLVSVNDVTRSELEAATAERELARARGDAETARLELGYLLNAEVAGMLLPPQGLLSAAAATPARSEALSADGRSRRLDVQAGERRVEALRASAEEPGRRLIPTVGLVGQYRVTNEAGFSGRTGDGFAGLTATWPIYDGGDRGAEAAERTALARAGALEQQARIRSVDLDVRRGLVALTNAQAALKLALTAVEAGRRNAAETTELYRAGLAGALEVADANVRFFEAEVALAREHYALALAYLDVRAAIGEGPVPAGVRS